MKNLILPAMVAAVVAALPARAQTTVNWGNTATNLQLDSSWVGGVAPSNNLTDGAMLFTGAVTNQPSLTGTNRSIRGVIFQSAGWIVANGGAGTLSIGAGGVTNLAGTNSFTTQAALGADSTWSVASNGITSLGSTLTLGNFTLTKTGPGVLRFTRSSGNAFPGTNGTLLINEGSLRFAGTNHSLAAGQSLVVAGSSSLGIDGSFNFTNNGTLAISNGTFTVSPLNAGTKSIAFLGPLSTVPGTTVLLGSIAGPGTNLTVTFGTADAAKTLQSGLNLGAGSRLAVSGSNGLTILGTSIVAPSTAFIDFSDNTLLTFGMTNGVTLASTISGAGGILRQNTNGGGTLNLDGTNSYTGTTTLDFGSGNLEVRNAAGLGAADGTTNTGTILASGKIYISSGLTVTNEHILINNSAATGTLGAIGTNGNATWTGPVVIGATSTNPRIEARLDNTGSTFTIGGGISGAGGGSHAPVVSFQQWNATNEGNITVTGPVSDGTSGSLALAVNFSQNTNRTVTLAGTNTYSGNTTLNNGNFVLATNGVLTFKIGASGTNNAVVGARNAQFDGRFAFNLAGASTTVGDSWTIVGASVVETYGTNFLVDGFSGAGGNWTNTTNGVTYVFAQSNSVLTVLSNSSGNYTSWVAHWQTLYPGFTNTAGTDDPDGDAFDNNEEFAFDGNPAVGTPALLTASKSGTNAVFNFVARKSPPGGVTYQPRGTTNLAGGPWTNSTVTISNAADQTGLNLPADYERREFTVPAGSREFFQVQAVVAP